MDTLRTSAEPKKMPPSDLAATNGMDRRIEKQPWPPKRIARYAAAAMGLPLLAYLLLFKESVTRLNVSMERLTIATVELAAFQEFIPVIGTIEPRRTVFLDAVSGGRVAIRYLESGALVEIGDPILKLDNFDLQLRVSTQETLLLEQQNNLHNTRMAMEQNRIRLQGQVDEARYQVVQSRRTFEQNMKLAEKGLISKLELAVSREDYEYQAGRRDLLSLSFRQDSLLQSLQRVQMDNSEQRILANMEMLRQALENLVIRAPVAGQLTSLDAEIGESKSAGQRMGRIDVLDGHRVQAPIDEFYISRVRVGQTGEVDLAGESFTLEITKIYPEVLDGRFRIDLEFNGSVPPDIRRGQTLRIRLALGNLSEAVLLARGGFFQSTGGRWAYVVDAAGSAAVRREIKLGRQNPLHFEVLEGLAPGDRVVISSYDNYGDIQQLVFKQQ
ncbi:MAG: efflux RND transporter periplasmic adaptor subunit [Candidatus Marinimicrobia bacterium]|nr:efflux RND transporter periplasmic adaptor subunit [Candidatus Neomarinimicrobiota bacterium]